MKYSELIAKTDQELATMLADSRKTLAQLAIDYRTKQVKNVKQMHGLKRSIAQVRTLQRQRQEVTNG